MSTTLSDLTEDYRGESFAPSLVCPVCAGPSQILHSASNIHPNKPYAFNFRVCSACDHGWIDPMPTQGLLNHLYACGSRSVIGEWGTSPLTIPEQVCVRREMKRPPARYFELGVGHGHLYQLFVEGGWECTGVDPGDCVGGFPNVHRDLRDVDPILSADLLVAFDVLEHVSDPVSMLRSLRKLAAPKARLYCAMPNRESLRARRDRQNWRMVRPLGHVNYYSKKSITQALRLARFAVRHVRATDLNELRFPRRRQDIRPALIEMLGLGDQWILIAEPC
jgi:SAM-dependent methyltransferase